MRGSGPPPPRFFKIYCFSLLVYVDYVIILTFDRGPTPRKNPVSAPGYHGTPHITLPITGRLVTF